ncbi:MAG: Gfo/Idh/MocA family oxidoreductase [Deltaproteobacteria bacterium]|nr:Gfo/Idh/MocA family oxidoreductase [Deltaproteobacteria bacterium]
MPRVKIIGAGSIGNHLAHASRSLGWEVTVCDVDKAALSRMKNDIYPQRYGAWDDTIALYHSDDAPIGNFDFIFIGTPPDSHLPLAMEALREKPNAILIEKPICPPSLDLTNDFFQQLTKSTTKVFVGYDHVVGRAAAKVEEILKTGVVGDIQTIDVEFREHWGGIFKAHPWLSGPADSYLGFWERGGGASGEHSHAANLWQHFARIANAGRVTEVDAMLNYVSNGESLYDNICSLHLRTENGLMGRVIQDVVTVPHQKRVRIQASLASIEWIINYDQTGDGVLLFRPGKKEERFPIPKTRSDDFIEELKHIDGCLKEKSRAGNSGISIERGLDTMIVVAAAHLSEKTKSRVIIDYGSGYIMQALKAI